MGAFKTVMTIRAVLITLVTLAGVTIAHSSPLFNETVTLREFINAMPDSLQSDGDLVYKMWNDQKNAPRTQVLVPNDTCDKPGDCGRAYQACCVLYASKYHAPCTCHLCAGSGAAGSSCGHCGIAYATCCVGFKAKGFPCTCDVK